MELEPTDLAALDTSRAVDLLTDRRIEDLRRRSTPLNRELILIDVAELDDDEHARLDTQAALQPVLRSEDDTLLVALPEVRVEQTGEHIREFLESEKARVSILQDRGDRIVIEPESGRGEDAIALCNELTELDSGAIVQPRFLRLLKRPGSQESRY